MTKMKRVLFHSMIVLGLVASLFSCTKFDDKKLPPESILIPITDWTQTKESNAFLEDTEHIRSYVSDGCVVYEYSGAEDILWAYGFSSSGILCASSVMLPESQANEARLRRLLNDYYFLVKKSDSNVYYSRSNATVAMFFHRCVYSDRNYVALCFSPYTPSETTDDSVLPYVDLGLSVKWAKTNIGAAAPEETGDYYAWGETSTKSEYWRENYKYAYESPKYIFNYTNPVSRISGTKYDAAYVKTDGQFRMPTRAEALELIYGCKWEQGTVGSVKVFVVTGPSGNSIVIPSEGKKKQNGKYEHWLALRVGDSYNDDRKNESAYSIEWNPNPVLRDEWKAWGLVIRPVLNE